MVGIKPGCFKDLLKNQSFIFVDMNQIGIKIATAVFNVKFWKYVSTERIRKMYNNLLRLLWDFFFPLESITYQMNIYLLMIHYTPIITKTFIFRCKLKKVLKVTSCLQCLEAGRNIKPTRINKMVHLQFTS